MRDAILNHAKSHENLRELLNRTVMREKQRECRDLGFARSL